MYYDHGWPFLEPVFPPHVVENRKSVLQNSPPREFALVELFWLRLAQTLAEQFFSIDLLKKKEKSVAIENSIFQVKINRNVILVYRFLLIFEALFY